MKLRFIHTADLQLGMTRHFLDVGAQERFTQARIDSIRALGRIAQEEGCDFAVIAGDTFEHNQVDRKTVSRSLEAIREIRIPVFMLPANHDPLSDDSVFSSPSFIASKPPNLTVISNSEPIPVAEGVEILGAVWRSKRPERDLVAEVIERLSSSSDRLRILVAHGIVDSLAADKDNSCNISLSSMERAVADGTIHYIALGDRHSVTSLGSTGKIWYSGSPEPTDFGETRVGFVLVVELDLERATVREFPTATWRFEFIDGFEVNSRSDIELLESKLDRMTAREKTILKLRLKGGLSIGLRSELETLVERQRLLFGGLQLIDSEVVTIPQDDDFDDLELSGFAKSTLEVLRVRATGEGPDALAAREALAIYIRLAKSRS